MSNILRRSSRKRSAPRTLDSTAPSQPSAAHRLPVTTQAIHHGQISSAPIVRTTSMPSTITQAVPQSTNATLLVTATSARHGCLPVYNASLQGPSDSQLTAYKMPVYKYNQPALVAIL